MGWAMSDPWQPAERVKPKFEEEVTESQKRGPRSGETEAEVEGKPDSDGQGTDEG
jgi:hypothetical protein